jgi:hypothetical protein
LILEVEWYDDAGGIRFGSLVKIPLKTNGGSGRPQLAKQIDRQRDIGAHAEADPAF